MEENTPPTEYQIPAYRRYITTLSMAGMAAFFWVMQSNQPTVLGGLAATLLTGVCIWSSIRMAENFRRRNP